MYTAEMGTAALDGERSPFVPLMRKIEAAESLDRVADRVAPYVAPMAGCGRLGDWLRGDWLGHALHPLLTDFPLGAWTCTSLLDLFGGRRSRPAATGLLAFGLAAGLPTAVAGVAEWMITTGKPRRVGVVHAALNLTAYGLYGASYLARRRGRHMLAVGVGLAGGVTATVGGYFGGHLTLARNVGTADPAFR